MALLLALYDMAQSQSPPLGAAQAMLPIDALNLESVSAAENPRPKPTQ